MQQEANQSLAEGLRERPDLPAEAEPLPCATGTAVELLDEEHQSIASMAQAIDQAQDYVHAEVYIVAWDQTTAPFFETLERAAERGVKVRMLLDQLGSRKYLGYKELGKRCTDAGFEWHLVMPLQGQWRRPGLRNHRKLVVVDGRVMFMGSQNMIDSTYLSSKNLQIGRHWVDAMLRLEGQIVQELETVFAVDWYAETGGAPARR